MALKLKKASSDWPDCLEGGRNYRVLKHHAVLLSAPNRFGSRRNCMALKQTRHRKSVKEGNCIGLKHDRVACYTKVWFGSIRNCMVLKLEKMFRVLHRGFGRREITWVQTGFFRCADGFQDWKGVKLQGTQTAYGTGRCYNKPCEQKPTPGL